MPGTVIEGKNRKMYRIDKNCCIYIYVIENLTNYTSYSGKALKTKNCPRALQYLKTTRLWHIFSILQVHYKNDMMFHFGYRLPEDIKLTEFSTIFISCFEGIPRTHVTRHKFPSLCIVLK